MIAGMRRLRVFFGGVYWVYWCITGVLLFHHDTPAKNTVYESVFVLLVYWCITFSIKKKKNRVLIDERVVSKKKIEC